MALPDKQIAASRAEWCHPRHAMAARSEPAAERPIHSLYATDAASPLGHCAINCTHATYIVRKYIFMPINIFVHKILSMCIVQLKSAQRGTFPHALAHNNLQQQIGDTT